MSRYKTIYTEMQRGLLPEKTRKKLEPGELYTWICQDAFMHTDCLRDVGDPGFEELQLTKDSCLIYLYSGIAQIMDTHDEQYIHRSLYHVFGVSKGLIKLADFCDSCEDGYLTSCKVSLIAQIKKIS